MKSKIFSKVILFVTVGTVLAIFLANSIVDPLWYFQGNIIKGENPRYNERFAKINLYAKNMGQYNCFIFGSSRTTLLNENLIEGYRCFNFSFSSGKLEEFSAYADWLLSRSVMPELVIVGIDDFSLVSNSKAVTVPDFILSDKEPPGPFDSYLSLQMLQKSFHIFVEGIKKPRFYDREFVGRVKIGLPSYVPPELSKLPKYLQIEAKDCVSCEVSVIRYTDFARKFEGARVVGYVPPVSFWYLASKSDDSYTKYLEILYLLSNDRSFSALYDFTVPSEITSSISETYDGSHFSSAVNDRLAACISGNQCGFDHLRPDKTSRDEYVSRHQLAMDMINFAIR